MFEVTLTVLVLISSLFTCFLLLLPDQYSPKARGLVSQDGDVDDKGSTQPRKHISVQVVVLGDIGRSPRMQYQALSIAEHFGEVQLVGYLDADPLLELTSNPRVSIHPLASPPRAWQTSNKLLFLLLAPLKVMFQVWTLWRVLGYRTKAAKWMLVQNPPSIPTLAIAVVVCFLRSTKLVIDWHNFGYSILALKLGSQHPLVKISEEYEKTLARCATAHFTVTSAMARVLRERFNLQSNLLTLHDRPAAQFQPFTAAAREAFLSMHPIVEDFETKIVKRKARLLVSSTSWTPDEDFSVLLEALCTYSRKAVSTQTRLPEILVVITGKGPQKDHYVQQIKELREGDQLQMVTIKTAWLGFEDYASLLASADLGVSLHTSSSGVDLPMKVVDMFGAGLPVAGWSKFEAWPELVTEGVNGRGFTSADQLVEILVDLFDPTSKNLAALKQGAIVEGNRRWDDEWSLVAGRLFELTS